MKLRQIALLALTGVSISLAAAPSAAANKRQEERTQEILSRYEKTGESIYCLSLSSVRSTDVLDDHTILVTAQGGSVYMSELLGRCIGLGRERRYIHEATTNRMCRGDLIRVVSNFGTAIGSCSFGSFEKLKEISQAE
ncbi:DUF6491 family protein [Hyphococcus formosus]|uniref:DUF6491 family protein n=1 Tax=Hyphococcus formosus TaxID=3143534 RepID=UPI00398B1A03